MLCKPDAECVQCQVLMHGCLSRLCVVLLMGLNAPQCLVIIGLPCWTMQVIQHARSQASKQVGRNPNYLCWTMQVIQHARSQASELRRDGKNDEVRVGSP